MKYLSAFVTHVLLKKHLRKRKIQFATFWEDGATKSAAAYGDIYEMHLPFFMTKNDEIKITYSKFPNGNKGYFNETKEVTLKFTDYIFYKKPKGDYCVQVGCLVKMYKNCPSIDYYTIQENSKEILADDVRSLVPDQNFHDRDQKTYTVYLIQATVGKTHTMKFADVLHFLQKIEAEVKNTVGQTNRKETLKNSLLGKRVTVVLCYLQSLVHEKFDAPGQDKLSNFPVTRNAGAAVQVRRTLSTKLKVWYAVVNPYE